jgi:hypothetical protein
MPLKIVRCAEVNDLSVHILGSMGTLIMINLARVFRNGVQGSSGLFSIVATAHDTDQV